MTHKIQIINKHKKQQLLNKFIIYLLAALTCSLFCSSPFWYPPLCDTINVFLSVSLPKFASLFFSTKVLFIIGNLIVIFLVGESKFFTSDSSRVNDVHHYEHVKDGEKLDKGFEEKLKKSITSSSSSSYKEEYWREEIKGVEKRFEGEIIILAAEQLSKKADDFIARVNKQRQLEAVLYSTTCD